MRRADLRAVPRLRRASMSVAAATSVACAAAAAAARAAVSLSSRAIRSLSDVAFLAEFGRALLLRAERVLRRGQGLLARVDKRGEPHLVDGERLALLGQRIALPSDRLPGLGESVEIAPRRLDLRFQFRNDRGQNRGRAHRLGHVVRLDENGGRRMAAHSLQRGKHVGDHGPPALKRAREPIGRGVEARQFVGRRGGARARCPAPWPSCR